MSDENVNAENVNTTDDVTTDDVTTDDVTTNADNTDNVNTDDVNAVTTEDVNAVTTEDDVQEFVCCECSSPPDSRDWVAESIYPITKDINLPKILDLRAYLPLPRNQGSRGTCAAFTAAAIKEYQEYMDYGFAGNMSPEYIYHFRENVPDEGMFGRNVMKILSQHGVCTERQLPYRTPDKDIQGKLLPVSELSDFSDALLAQGRKHVIKNYAQVNTIAGLKTALYKNGPCYISFPTYSRRPELWRASPGEEATGGHAMTVVGYNESGFIIRNSWGWKWNGNGCVIYPYEEFGVHWEIWTLIDDKSQMEDITRNSLATNLKKIFLCFQGS